MLLKLNNECLEPIVNVVNDNGIFSVKIIEIDEGKLRVKYDYNVLAWQISAALYLFIIV